MIYRRIVKCVNRSDFGMSGRETRPDFAADKAAATVLEVVAHAPRERRSDTSAKIGLADAVLRPIRRDVGQPIVGENVCRNARAVFLDGAQPGNLQIEVVVWRRIALDVGLKIPFDVHLAALALERRAQRSAGVFPLPAPGNPVAKLAVP